MASPAPYHRRYPTAEAEPPQLVGDGTTKQLAWPVVEAVEEHFELTVARSPTAS